MRKECIDDFDYQKAKHLWLDIKPDSRELAELIGISRVLLYKIISGEKKPKIEYVKYIARALKVNIKDLIKGE